MKNEMVIAETPILVTLIIVIRKVNISHLIDEESLLTISVHFFSLTFLPIDI